MCSDSRPDPFADALNERLQADYDRLFLAELERFAKELGADHPPSKEVGQPASFPSEDRLREDRRMNRAEVQRSARHAGFTTAQADLLADIAERESQQAPPVAPGRPQDRVLPNLPGAVPDTGQTLDCFFYCVDRADVYHVAGRFKTHSPSCRGLHFTVCAGLPSDAV